MLLLTFLVQNCATNKKIIKEKPRSSAVAQTSTSNINNKDLSILDMHTAEIKMLNKRIKELEDMVVSFQDSTVLFAEPLAMYEKKIILNNGTVLFGTIVFQDEHMIQAETLIGTLSLDKQSIIRVVDRSVMPIVNSEDKMIELNLTSDNNSSIGDNTSYNQSAKVILLGEFLETKDENNNIILSGQVKNIGSKRADFSKITFTIFKDQMQGSSNKEYTSFVAGSSVSFDRTVTSSSSLYPDEVGTFSVLIPSDFGPFLSYEYYLDWEEYE
jgi:hypothetical protein